MSGLSLATRSPVDPGLQEQVRTFDDQMLDRAAACDPGGWFRTAAGVGNRYRVCGLAATYTMLQAIGPAQGRLLKYKQALDDRRTCCVSFASMVFHAHEPSLTQADRPMSQPLPEERPATGTADHPVDRPPCPAPADFRRGVISLRQKRRDRPLGWPAIPHDLSGPGSGPTARSCTWDRVDLSHLCASCSTDWPIGSEPSFTTTLASILTTAPIWPGSATISWSTICSD